MGTMRVIEPGLFTTVQDLGRDGWSAHGVPVGGAVDPLSLRLGNRLVGNQEGAPALEMTLTGVTLEFDSDANVTLTGGELVAWIERDGSPPNRAAGCRALHMRAGDQLRCGAMTRGSRAYLCVRGFSAARVLGSASTHVPSGFGGHDGRELRAGDRLTYADGSGHHAPGASESAAAAMVETVLSRREIRAVAGAHAENFDCRTTERFWNSTFTVTSQSDRMGMRLLGVEPLDAGPGRMLSEGMPWGAVQIPPGGLPIVMMPDHPTTGGYPVIACVASVDLPALGQLRSGQVIRFQEVSLGEARRLFFEREQAFAAIHPT